MDARISPNVTSGGQTIWNSARCGLVSSAKALACVRGGLMTVGAEEAVECTAFAAELSSTTPLTVQGELRDCEILSAGAHSASLFATDPVIIGFSAVVNSDATESQFCRSLLEFDRVGE